MNDTSATETKKIKIVMTDEQRREKRRAYAKKYYAGHKEQMIAACKRCRANKKNKAAVKQQAPTEHAVETLKAADGIAIVEA